MTSIIAADGLTDSYYSEGEILEQYGKLKMTEPYRHNPHAPAHLNKQAREDAVKRGENVGENVHSVPPDEATRPVPQKPEVS